jgi:hypothetical protein
MNPDSIVYTAQEPRRWETSQCGGEVRWKNGKLQQVFVITEYVGGSPSGQRQEWRDVPTDQ